MIPRAHIIEWRATGYPWQTDAMVEQDLLLGRVLVELFTDMEISRQLVFRGGTALHKLFFKSPMRYSEDITWFSAKRDLSARCSIGCVNFLKAGWVCRDGRAGAAEAWLA